MVKLFPHPIWRGFKRTGRAQWAGTREGVLCFHLSVNKRKGSQTRLIWILHWSKIQMNRCFKGEDSCTMTDRGAWIEINSCKLFSQGVPTTALGFTIIAATCETYRLWHWSRKSGKRCLVSGKESFLTNIRCCFPAIKTHTTLGGFFNMQWQREETRTEKYQGLWHWLQKPTRLAAVEGPKLNPCWWAKGNKHRTFPRCLEPSLLHVSGDCGNIQTSGTSLWLAPEPGKKVASLTLVGSGLS